MYLEPLYIMTANIKIRQYVIFVEPQKNYTADIKCFTEHKSLDPNKMSTRKEY